ncbi:hypothetical protein EZS27_034235 [termite gut metagenome]|uniref:Uncharacterized protein n=1 Tax=termite gut metagenome TaxID=433724 RepID=A0A5J4Q3R1_9ZZZZ
MYKTIYKFLFDGYLIDTKVIENTNRNKNDRSATYRPTK